MAKEMRTKVEVDVTRAKAGLEELGKGFDDVGRRARRGAETSKKDWFGVANLFADVLPRGLSRTIRKMQSSTRSVGRLSKGFAGLKGAIASTGIGLLVVALGALVQHWDLVTEKLSGVTDAQKAQAASMKAQREEVESTTRATENYLEIINDTSVAIEKRRVAQNELSNVVREAAGYDIDTADGLERLNEEVNRRIQLGGLEALMMSNRNAVTAAEVKLGEKTIKMTAGVVWGYRRKRKATEELEAAQLVLSTATSDYTDLLVELGKEEDKRKGEREAAAEAAKEEAKALRELETAKADAERKRVINAKFLREEMLSIDQERELRTMSERDQLEQKIFWQFEADLKKFEAAEASETEMEAMTARFMDRHVDAMKEFDDAEAKRVAEVEQEKQLTWFDTFIKNGMFEQKAIDEMAKNRKDKAEKDADDEIKLAEAVADGKIAAMRAASSVFGQLESLAEKGSQEAKALAITQVLLSQAIAVSQAIAGATTAATATGPGVLVATPLFITQMVGTVLASFIGVKNILSEAGATMGGTDGITGGGGAPSFTTAANIPDTPQDQGFNNPWEGMTMQTYVVQSQLAAQQNAADRMNGLTVL